MVGYSIVKHTGDWLEGLSQKSYKIYPKMLIFKKSYVPLKYFFQNEINVRRILK